MQQFKLEPMMCFNYSKTFFLKSENYEIKLDTSKVKFRVLQISIMVVALFCSVTDCGAITVGVAIYG